MNPTATAIATPTAAARYGFDEHPCPDGIVFDVAPAPMAWGAFASFIVLALVLCGVLLPILTGLAAGLLGLGWRGFLLLTALGGAALLAWPIAAVRRMRQARRARRIELRPHGLVLEGMLYRRQDIQQLWVDGAHADTRYSEANNGQIVGMALANRMNRVNWSVKMRYGSEVVELAAGLEEGSARALERRLRSGLEGGR